MSEFFKRFSSKIINTSIGSTLSGTSDQPTQPFAHKANTPSADPHNASSSPFLVAVASSIGMQREHNEDAVFALTTTLVADNTNLPFGLYIIADGMGGHLHGSEASEVAMRAMANYILTKLLLPYLDVAAPDHEDSEQEIMEQGIYTAHQAIMRYATGGGSTLTCMLLLGKEMIIAHIGDSRAYKINTDGEIQQLTRDHSVVKRLEELGQITSDEAAIHPQRNILYRALGQMEKIDPEIISAPLPHSGFLLLCSDGLWGVISDTEQQKIISSAKSPQQASRELIKAANTAGGPDNISVIVIQLAAMSQDQGNDRQSIKKL